MSGLTPTAFSTPAGSGHNASHQPAVGISVPSKKAGGRGICAVGRQVSESIMWVLELTPWRKRQIDAAIHLDRHNARGSVLFLYRNSSASCPPEVQRVLAGDNGSSGLRARFPGSPKYTRMDANLSAFAMALCNLSV